MIRAFNDNKPFDEFTIEQLAGDLLPDSDTDDRVATGFNRNHMINHEGGAIPAEYHTEYVVDRVETVSTVWMAMTMGCARCHDHKYDPITQREFYEFYAFFNSVDELGLDGVNGNAVPMLQLPDPQQREDLDGIDAAIRSVQADLPAERIGRQIAQWEQTAIETIPTASREGLEAHYEMEGGFSDSSGNYRHGRVMRGEPLFGTANAGQGASFDVDTHVAFPRTRSIDVSKPFTLTFWMRHSGLVEKSLLHKMDGPEDSAGARAHAEPAGLDPRHAAAGVRTHRSAVPRHPGAPSRSSRRTRCATSAGWIPPTMWRSATTGLVTHPESGYSSTENGLRRRCSKITSSDRRIRGPQSRSGLAASGDATRGLWMICGSTRECWTDPRSARSTPMNRWQRCSQPHTSTARRFWQARPRRQRTTSTRPSPTPM